MLIGYKFIVKPLITFLSFSCLLFCVQRVIRFITKAIHQFSSGLKFANLIKIVLEFNLKTIIYKSRGE